MSARAFVLDTGDGSTGNSFDPGPQGPASPSTAASNRLSRTTT